MRKLQHAPGIPNLADLHYKLSKFVVSIQTTEAINFAV